MATPTIHVHSSDISSASLRISLPWYLHLYTIPALPFYPLLAYAYYVKYDAWLKSEEWTFLACVLLGAGHALSFLITRWNAGAKSWVTTRKATSLQEADCIRITPHPHRGQGEIVPLVLKDPSDPGSYTFNYQRDTYVLSPSSSASPSSTLEFTHLPYPSVSRPPLSSFSQPSGLSESEAKSTESKYGLNEFDIPVPTFLELFGEHATAPFFVFQIFCVALWCLDEYWYYSLFTLFMLIIFECTTVTQRLKTLQEFRTMSITPYPIPVLRNNTWVTLSTRDILPGDIVSVSRPSSADSAVPADILLLKGTAIVNEAMLSGESTPLLKESIELLDGSERLDVDGTHRNAVLFSGTKVLQAVPTSASTTDSADAGKKKEVKTPDGGCLGVVLRTGFGTTQGQLVRTMIFSTERVSANNLESFLFIGFLLVFAVAASWYVWVKGIERGLKKSKLLLDCVLIVTSVVPPELPMELSLAVNASLVALSKYAIFCTEPFRIPSAGRVDVCCFDKTGTITTEHLVLEGIAGVSSSSNIHQLTDIKSVGRNTTLCLAAAHALVQLDDGTVVGDPMEKTTLEALGWSIGKNDMVVPAGVKPTQGLRIRRRFQFSSALKRMSTLASSPDGKSFAAVKGAPETIRGMLSTVPAGYEDTYKWFTRRGSRVLALGIKEMGNLNGDAVNKVAREQVESALEFAGFLVFHCPLKEDAVESLKMLADASHRCIMITGDNPLTAVHVAQQVEIVDRDALILDSAENSTSETDLAWYAVDDSLIIPVSPSSSFDTSLFDKYDICVTGAALRQYPVGSKGWNLLVQNTWVYARVSPSQKEAILTSLKELGYITLMAGDGTNDVGALKQAHIGVALLDGTPEDLKKIAERARIERLKKVYESQIKLTARFGQPPPPVPPVLAQAYPELVKAQEQTAVAMKEQQRANPSQRFNIASMTDKLAELEDEEEVPKIKLGDASCAAPFTSKLSNVAAITAIIRQGRCTLVATIQMYKILALNCLITAWALSVQYLDGIKYGDYQMSITGMLMSVCFLCISRAKPVEKLSKERPLGNIFNLYVVLSVLLQFALHIVTMVYITDLSHKTEPREGPIDLDAKFEPSLLNTAIYLLGLSQQVSTFAINYQGRPFREGIRENKYLYYGLVGAAGVAYSGALDLMPEMNRWLQVVEMANWFKFRLTAAMVIDFAGCFIVEVGCKYLFADLEPKPLVTRGSERRLKRRAVQAIEAAKVEKEKEVAALEKKEL